jgi:hypothetical protein
MKINNASAAMILAHIAALASTVSAIPTNATIPALQRRDGVTCQTTDGSPNADDCQRAIDEMRADDSCTGTNPQGSGCLGIFTAGTCTVVVCVDDGLDSGFDVQRNRVVDQLQQLHDQCQNNGRVGGIYNYNAATSVSCGGNSVGYKGYVNVEFTTT